MHNVTAREGTTGIYSTTDGEEASHGHALIPACAYDFSVLNEEEFTHRILHGKLE